MHVLFVEKDSQLHSNDSNKVSHKEHATKDQTGNGNKDDKGGYKVSNCLWLEKLENHCKEN